MSAEEGKEQTRSTSDPHRAAVEWGTLLVSAALLLVLAGTLTYAHFSGGEQAPLIEARAETGSVRREGESWHLPIRVSNRGRTGAREIQLRVAPTGSSAGDPIDLLLDVLPAGGSQTVIAVLRADPSRTPVEARVVSYQTD